MQRDFTYQRIADVIRARLPRPRRVLIKCHHGLGDAVMFNGVVLRGLRLEFPDVEFTPWYHLGQGELFGTTEEFKEEDFDLAFEVAMPVAEWGAVEETKAEKCCRVEAGVKPGYEDYSLPARFPSPLVGVHFFSTSCRGLCAPEAFARQLWERIAAAGLLPIDTHIRHKWSHDVPWAWETRRIDEASASAGMLAGLIGGLGGFAGVASGNLWVALATLPPHKILAIETQFPATRLTRLPIYRVNALTPDWAVVEEWLKDVKR